VAYDIAEGPGKGSWQLFSVGGCLTSAACSGDDRLSDLLDLSGIVSPR